MDCDFERKMVYFRKVAASVGVPEMWVEDCAQEIALSVWKTADGACALSVVARQRAGMFLLSGLHPAGKLVRRGRRADGYVPPCETVDGGDGVLSVAAGDFEGWLVPWVDLMGVWSQLRAVERRALALKAAGYSEGEIGGVLGRSRGSASLLLARARRRLRCLLTEG